MNDSSSHHINAEPAGWPAPPRPIPAHGAPALKATTILRAEQLAHAGFGWSADHVMRKALELLEREAS